jgi:UrcA family protein
MFRILTTAALLALGVSAAGPVGAQPVTVVSTKVAYGDLDISRPEGARTLLSRIEHAGRKVCGPSPAIYDLHGASDYRRCRTEAVDKAVTDMRSPILTAMHEHRDIPTSVIQTAAR